MVGCGGADMLLFRMKQNTKKEWVADEEAGSCMVCNTSFTMFLRRHHCRMCGCLVCAKCSESRVMVPSIDTCDVRVCDGCVWGKDSS